MSQNWEVSWEDNKINIHKIGDEEKWIYELIKPPFCEMCGRSLIMGKYCFDDYRHTKLELADRTFQLGNYYPMSKIDEKVYDDILTQHILRLKSNNDYAEPIGIAMAMAMTKIPEYKIMLNADVLVPIPSYEKQINHSMAICNVISDYVKEHNNIEMPVLDYLTKVKSTKLHMLPSRADREEEVRDMFIAKNDIDIMKKNVLLVDDLLTTGDTKSECIRILKNNGALKIWVYVTAGNV